MKLTKHLQLSLWVCVFFTMTLLVALYSLSKGELAIPFHRIPGILFQGKESMEYTVLRDIRLPRIEMGLIVGGSLSLAGILLQGIYRNPLVEPYTMGISGGAALGVALVIVSGYIISIGSWILPLAGFAGAWLTVFFVYMLSSKRGRILTSNMVLVGVMISFIASSAMMFLLATTTNENLHSIIFWVMGSLDEVNGKLITISGAIAVISLLISYLFIHPLNALRLGEVKAGHLGINTDRSIKILFLVASLLTGMCVSVAGVIGFVGLVIPQAIRYLVGADFRILLITSFLSGGAFLIFCDTIARTIVAPNELPIGVITGMIGGLAFILILSRSGQKNQLRS